MANSIINNFAVVVDEKCIVNTTPHPINFVNREGKTITIPSSVAPGEKTSPWVVNARAIEEKVGKDLVRTVFEGTTEGKHILDQIETWAHEKGFENLRVIGSIIAAQAYPGRVLGMCPAPGFERVPPAEKRMSTQKFTVY